MLILSMKWPCVINTRFTIDSIYFNIRVISVKLGTRNTNDAGSSGQRIKTLIEIYSIYMVTSAKKYNQVGVEYQMSQIHVRYKRNNSYLVAYTFNGFPCTCIDLQNKCRLFFMIHWRNKTYILWLLFGDYYGRTRDLKGLTN